MYFETLQHVEKSKEIFVDYRALYQFREEPRPRTV